MLNIPVILYDINNDNIKTNTISKSNNYFIRSYQNFNISIIEDVESENKIYSVKQNPTPTSQDDLFLIESGKNFDNGNNFAYTIYLISDVKLLIIGKNHTEKIVNISFKPDNVLLDSQQHYNDLLVNNNLPTFDELVPALINNNQAEILKRLLLDFKNTFCGFKLFLVDQYLLFS